MTKTISNGTNTFTKTSKISEGYQVWNIPSLGEGLVPLFEPLEEYQVNPDTLQYIEVSPIEAKQLQYAASYAIRTLGQAQSILTSKRTGPTLMRKKGIAELVLPIFEKYTK